MDDLKFGEEIIADVHRIHKEKGREACEKFIHVLMADQSLGLTQLQKLELKSSFFCLERDRTNRVACYDEIIMLEHGLRAGSFFMRGMIKLRLKDLQGAINDFTQAIELEEQTPEKYDAELYYFFRAEMYLKVGRLEESLLDLENVPEDFECWTYKLRSKADLLADIHKIKKGG